MDCCIITVAALLLLVDGINHLRKFIRSFFYVYVRLATSPSVVITHGCLSFMVVSVVIMLGSLFFYHLSE